MYLVTPHFLVGRGAEQETVIQSLGPVRLYGRLTRVSDHDLEIADLLHEDCSVLVALDIHDPELDFDTLTEGLIVKIFGYWGGRSIRAIHIAAGEPDVIDGGDQEIWQFIEQRALEVLEIQSLIVGL